MKTLIKKVSTLQDKIKKLQFELDETILEIIKNEKN